ncbi:MAG: hypothetical protein Kow0013_10220 [Pararhodobacter sp.]
MGDTANITGGRKSTLARLRRNLVNIAGAPHALAMVERRYGKGVANRAALRRLAFFPKLGLAFNRVKKNANSALILLLFELETGRTGQAHAVKDETPNLFDLTRAQVSELDRYAVLVTVRNPYSRVLSAFLDKFRFERYRKKHGDFALTPEGFGAFLTWLDRGGLMRDPHWDLQTKLIALPLDRYDAVFRFESLRTDALAFLASRGLVVPEGALAGEHKGDAGKETGASSRMAAFYTPERAELVARLYAADFAALGYPTSFPAELA